ncbi:BolA-like protein 2 [Morella rubra]|uniref:BolA-like protein 2 n=1 Tax=Morella rubra TaxID=262757 RepID=A0A6A1VCM5_9ROSI|nr:BolA-like protein 2 [Morella rubra]KAB1210599.1 BolA-like protein 2 [Morella rubra]
MGVTKEQVESTLKSKMNPSQLRRNSGASSVLKRKQFKFCLISLSYLSYPIQNLYVAEKKDVQGTEEVIDTSGGCGASFAIEIVSEQFEGKRLLERHRLVNAALEQEMKQIHALSIKKALTPEQWKQQQESEKSNPAS